MGGSPDRRPFDGTFDKRDERLREIDARGAEAPTLEADDSTTSGACQARLSGHGPLPLSGRFYPHDV